MPIVEFSCRKCQHKFEELILKKEGVGTIKCPRCGSRSLIRLYSTFGFGGNGLTEDRNMGSTCTSCARSSCAGCSK